MNEEEGEYGQSTRLEIGKNYVTERAILEKWVIVNTIIEKWVIDRVSLLN